MSLRASLTNGEEARERSARKAAPFLHWPVWTRRHKNEYSLVFEPALSAGVIFDQTVTVAK